MKRLLQTPTLMLVRRIVLLYAVLMLCRIVFYAYNAASLGALTGDELGLLLRGALTFDTASIIYADGLFILLSLLPFRLYERRWWRRLLFSYYIVVNTVLIIAINLSDAVYFRYTQKRFTADEVFFADNDNSVQLIGKFLAENWYLGLVAIALAGLLAWGYGFRVKQVSLLKGGLPDFLGRTFILVLGAALCLAGVRGGMTRMTRPITLSNATLYSADNGKANLILSNPFCILRTAGGESVKFKRYFPDEELPHLFTPEHRPSEYADTLHNNTDDMCRTLPEGNILPGIVPAPPRPDSTTFGSLAGRNVMIFIMESMSAEHSAYLRPDLYASLPEKGFTPFLDSLMRNGLTFNQMYANGTRSIQAMPSVLGSIPSFRTPFVLMPQSLGESRQLPAILAGKGYSTAFFCGSEHGSMGFGAYARSAGVEQLVSREEYEAVHGTSDFDGYWGIWDEEFLQFTGEELARMPQPFFGTLFTLSSHHPFNVPSRYEHTLPQGYTKIHKGVAYDDNAFRLFFQRFGAEEWFRRTVFVFVADHVSSEKFATDTHEYPGNMHIIGLMYTPDGALRGGVAEVTQQLDLMPTLLGLLGNTEPYFAFGRDVFNEPQRPHWSVSYDGQFRALTSRSIIRFDEESAEVTPRSADSAAENALLDPFRALIQQYYTRIKQKCYTVHD